MPDYMVTFTNPTGRRRMGLIRVITAPCAGEAETIARKLWPAFASYNLDICRKVSHIEESKGKGRSIFS